ncbi:MAG: hypothetical protein AAF360_10775 [Pseudomonadota bacterium]
MLRYVLITNAASCIGFGALFAAAPGFVVAHIAGGDGGGPPQFLLIALGLGLIANGAHLIWTAAQAAPARSTILYFVMGDAGWVAATGVLLVAGLWITTTTGVVWSLAVAGFVAACGVAQWRLAPPAAS